MVQKTIIDNIPGEIQMKILIIPMSAMAETSGPTSRCRLIAKGLRAAGFEAATCMAKDVNYKNINAVPNYYLDIPMPLGLPAPIAKRTFPIAQKLGITSRKTVNSFDEVLYMTGNLNYRYLRKSVVSIRKAIRSFRPDAIYSEFNISAIIAARKEGIPVYCSVSYPTQHEYAHNNKLAKGLNRVLKALKLPRVDSALQLFDWAEKSFCPSIRRFEPIDKENVFYCGAMGKTLSESCDEPDRNKIVVYMGNGTISADKMLKEISEAFKKSRYEVYIASSYLKKEDNGNIHVAPRWNFNELLSEAVLFINHGGQNSIVDGLLHSVPQLIVPGKVFERKFNAKCVEDNHAGMIIEDGEFKADRIRRSADKIIRNDNMRTAAYRLGKELSEAGGVEKIISEITE